MATLRQRKANARRRARKQRVKWQDPKYKGPHHRWQKNMIRLMEQPWGSRGRKPGLIPRDED